VRTFLVAVAVLIGLANTLFYSGFGGSAWGGPFVWRLDPWPGGSIPGRWSLFTRFAQSLRGS
jgi:hypothetical protein